MPTLFHARTLFGSALVAAWKAARRRRVAAIEVHPTELEVAGGPLGPRGGHLREAFRGAGEVAAVVQHAAFEQEIVGVAGHRRRWRVRRSPALPPGGPTDARPSP